jgi:hypothetical protein
MAKFLLWSRGMICPYFHFYHNELICKCTQEESKCCAILEQCENKIGRGAYEADLKEENDKLNRIS